MEIMNNAVGNSRQPLGNFISFLDTIGIEDRGHSSTNGLAIRRDDGKHYRCWGICHDVISFLDVFV